MCGHRFNSSLGSFLVAKQKAGHFPSSHTFNTLVTSAGLVSDVIKEEVVPDRQPGVSIRDLFCRSETTEVS